MSSFKGMTSGGTLAALQAAQIELQKHLKEDARVRARRCVMSHSTKMQWPIEDLAEVLGALGLEPVDVDMDTKAPE